MQSVVDVIVLRHVLGIVEIDELVVTQRPVRYDRDGGEGDADQERAMREHRQERILAATKGANLFDSLKAGVGKVVRSYWGKRGEQVVQDNLTCIRRGYTDVFELPRELINDTSLDDVSSVALPVVS
jgi:hypothetical protein